MLLIIIIIIIISVALLILVHTAPDFTPRPPLEHRAAVHVFNNNRIITLTGSTHGIAFAHGLHCVERGHGRNTFSADTDHVHHFVGRGRIVNFVARVDWFYVE